MAVAWDPAQYLRFSGERLRPALDLLARVPLPEPALVTDLGCGPGNVTAIIRNRFPGADVTGLDSSAVMLERARRDVPDCRFEVADAAAWTPAAPPDLIYSNAALHWLGGHERLFPRLVSLLAPGGCLAVQMPAMHDAPFRAAQYEIAASGPWSEQLVHVRSAPPILDPGAYWDLLRPITASLDLWDTTYMHALQGEDAVVQWAMGTSLRPFLDPLADGMRAAFLAAYAETIRPHYPKRGDGTTLLPFRRRFIIATAPGPGPAARSAPRAR